MTDERSVEEIQGDNWKHFLKRGPALSFAYGHYIVAKDSRMQMTLLGGLGGMGVGQMWGRTSERDKQTPGWEEAEEREWKGSGWGSLMPEQRWRELEGIHLQGPLCAYCEVTLWNRLHRCETNTIENEYESVLEKCNNNCHHVYEHMRPYAVCVAEARADMRRAFQEDREN